jgi:hypothetical protein
MVERRAAAKVPIAKSGYLRRYPAIRRAMDMEIEA